MIAQNDVLGYFAGGLQGRFQLWEAPSCWPRGHSERDLSSPAGSSPSVGDGPMFTVKQQQRSAWRLLGLAEETRGT